ncbi:hypothetical protein SAMN05444365_10612 [Micromonospora pattaloongensis]|uniref:Response regulatory domain-containing protein n=1 Tax=Micromonospora pattaloongensis TaxID=405436 RepID=A0A1H3QNN4_9ACTN|nr:hypothetical protein [Micromonospora pattaloongensis]SDZ14595.1 hypothetical protein SAMN05444365_10612 [Micromonospora pattaloongensis]
MPIRLAVSQLPEMLVDVVREAFRAEPDVSVEVLRSVDGDVSAAIRRTGPDIVIVGTEGGDGRPNCDLLLAHPDVVVLNLSPDARSGWICELRPCARSLGELSLSSLRATVHEAILRKQAGGHGVG